MTWSIRYEGPGKNLQAAQTAFLEFAETPTLEDYTTINITGWDGGLNYNRTVAKPEEK